MPRDHVHSLTCYNANTLLMECKGRDSSITGRKRWVENGGTETGHPGPIEQRVIDRHAKKQRIYCAVIGDGYLYGGSYEAAAAHATGNQYWMGLRMEPTSFEIWAAKVPPELGDRLLNQGTSQQSFSDGYEAMRAFNAYKPKKIDSWNAPRSDEDD